MEENDDPTNQKILYATDLTKNASYVFYFVARCRISRIFLLMFRQWQPDLRNCSIIRSNAEGPNRSVGEAKETDDHS
jgi:hypothetical protein